MIHEELASFLQAGVSIHIGTRDDRLRPNGARAAAVKVGDEGRHFVVYLAKVAAERILPDLRSNGLAAVVFCRPTDDRSCQVKGVFVSARAARADERALVDRQWKEFLDELAQIGIPREATAAWITWPAVAIKLRATALFDQTPGPGAGAPIQ
jgi:hypothetical protein